MFEEIPVDVGLVHEGERIRKNDMQIELGGPKVDEKFELVRLKPAREIESGSIHIIGPDIPDLEEGKSHPFGILIEIAGPELEENLEGVIERRIHEYCNYIEGLMHLNQRYDIWMRLSKKAFQKGLDSFRFLGMAMQELFRNELPIIEDIQITFITDPEEVKARYDEALAIYEARDARARGLSDEDVDVFYGCALCQSFAPTHVCVVTPQRYANCGAISWFDGRAAARIDPKGPIFPIEKGECLDTETGEYTGVNESAQARSMGEVSRIQLYSGFGYPHTSCGCFEAIAFYIPEVAGYGIVHRGFTDLAVNGLPFSTMADSTAGGRQIDGFHGISIEYMRSEKFLQADGGYDAVVWIPVEIKDRLKDYIPEDVSPAIATEKDVQTIGDLKEFLLSHSHPVTARWVKEEEEPEEAPVMTAGEIPITTGGFRIILKNARIYADRVIIQPVQPKKPGRGDS
ncbi:MAG: CO dehydrogenase/CO-methylating acetyl-CoA synthase complex subunit beta [Methanocalculus sp. MSAO_Arc1]|uniref:CO dehydrogenase/CO-methylating acetyl-CoA synthase complex subunit beta n=1 Tax=Methanocalculus TaxID=71151 RepID=UPI000FF32C6F|nr:MULTISPECIES: CO dehydrogenase/CO-methylating acetyl-CoA synthase complex subunit beta [unclassified Methanocalculus]MCP1662556.1 acetyl-CoA decarbonylase/synthase complex subunit beta [Methanocalculus sp. AMF5]RQD80072.1 MAG: CO dehydrogenase/CO-methylating acetyl-CoA synthase complex subunit beta [Methanocalculus sp. MSAO_Arc1]